VVLFLGVACLINSDLYRERLEDLTDHDGDGVAQEDDCDDTSASVFPGASESCDGRDEDCDGLVDEDATDAPRWYRDDDADGYGAASDPGTVRCDAPAGTVANRLDCDDGAARTNPAAFEIPYDGVDNDCDGSDLSDVDGDGADAIESGGDDCDDEDAAINPAATEVPYDGIDQDCRDGDADDLDDDGVPGAAAGGEDCDDADSEVYPGAVETWADGFTDNDCDGELEPVQLEYGSNVWAGRAEDDDAGRRVVSLGDLDGNGLREVLVGSEYDTTLGSGSGALYAVDGAPGGWLDDGRVLLPDVPGEYFGADVDAGLDVTGDGVPDMAVSNSVGDTEAGSAWLVDGAEWARVGQAAVSDVSIGRVRGSGPGTYGPNSVRLLGDVTGDGVPDVAMNECCGTSAGADDHGRVAIFSADAFVGTVEDADVLITGPWAGAYIGGQLDPAGDQDGDGLDDLVVGGMGGFGGAIVGGTRSGSVADVAITLVYAGDYNGYADARAVGDLDGDGRIDIAILGGDDDNYLYFFTRLDESPTRLLQEPSFRFEWEGHGEVRDSVPLGDLDGDGRDELFLPQYYSDAGDEHAWILRGCDTSTGADVRAEDALLTAVPTVPGSAMGYRAALVGDVDGDGRDDIALGAPAFPVGSARPGGATLIPVPR
jgi:hypothetical protein